MNPSLTTTVVLFLATMGKTESFSQPTFWATYKETLREKGAMDIEREYTIEAINVGAGSRIEDSILDDDNQDVSTKIIHFQRHGQGYHNLLGDVTRALGVDIDINEPDPSKNPFTKPEIQDSPLTFKGREEAAAQQIGAAMLNPEVVIVSPLHRAVQTALISFQDHLNNDVPFVAHEGCREQLGLLTCNKALPLSRTKADFPQVDFSNCIAGEDDSLWNEKPNEREHPVAEADRAYTFLTEFIMNRPEKEMAIVCHSAWLFSVCNAVIDCGGDESLESWFGTGEIRSLKVSFRKK